jgi:hypothetical protein
MDPQQTWKELLEAVESHDTETARDRALSLMEWLARGGFPPVMNNNTSLTADQHRQIVRDYCRNVLWQQPAL